MPRYGGRPQPGGFCVNWGPSHCSRKRAEPPLVFGPCLLRPNGCMDHDATWYGGRPRPRRHCVRALLFRKSGGAPLQLSAHVYCGRTPEWIKMSLAWKLALSQSTLCWMRTQLPSPKREQSPLQFSAHFCCGQTSGCIKMPLRMEVGLSPGDLVLNGDPATPPEKGCVAPTNFRPMSTAAKQLHGPRCHLVRR